MADEKDITKTEAPKASPTPAPRGNTEAQRNEESAPERDRARRGITNAGITEAQAAEYDELDIDPRLDNRIGRQRPRKPAAPKPQQVSADDGARALGIHDDDRGEPLGMRSVGPHGVGEGRAPEELG